MATATAPKPPPVTDAERERLDKAYRLAKDGPGYPRLFELAAVAGMSPFHFHRRFHRAYGVTPKAVVTARQIEDAKWMLMGGEPLLGIAGACGFANQSHFTSRFRMATGDTPTRWMRKQLAKR